MRPMLKALMVLTLGAAGALGGASPAQVPPQIAGSSARPAHAGAVAAARRQRPRRRSRRARTKPPPDVQPREAAAPTNTQPANGPRLQPGTPIPPAELEAFVDGVVREAMTTGHIAGAAVSVVQNGQVVLKKGYGFAAPGRAVDPDNTLFRIGSISKTFTWIAVMKEVEAGRMRLSAPIDLYLPEPLQIPDQGFAQPILVRDLMSHSGGFEDRTLGQLFERSPDRIRPLADYLREERPRRVRPSGQVSVYSNYGAMLAGRGDVLRRRPPLPGPDRDRDHRPPRHVPHHVQGALSGSGGPAEADAGLARRRGLDRLPLGGRQLAAAVVRVRDPGRAGRRWLVHRRRHGSLHDDDPERRPAGRRDHLWPGDGRRLPHHRVRERARR